MAQTNEYDYLLKILLIGDSNVGKTCILRQFTENYFDESPISTIGLDFRIRMIHEEGKRTKLMVWDTAGHERFRSITAAYYRGAHGILLVYNITDRDSFDHIKHWLSDINRYSSQHVCKVLIGNKSDLNESRQVSYDEGLEFASKLGMEFMETSAKTAHNVENAFLNMANEIGAPWKSDDRRNVVIVSEPVARNRFGCCSG
eukprot:CAMPEP_0185727868 /NCGR_PEP_ID=MMETSP1171-20130828/3428_1 /TAXON_ID=374046 /ORGANISM="Helicotheca tamensis, Strain CCMP826" /LENGTH=200 /DNA_ID=CAMNT_0028396509 /DNA_START=64 /DNA_END=666 /DNA_ORIENTATION=-